MIEMVPAARLACLNGFFIFNLPHSISIAVRRQFAIATSFEEKKRCDRTSLESRMGPRTSYRDEWHGGPCAIASPTQLYIPPQQDDSYVVQTTNHFIVMQKNRVDNH
ncbi:hypothetical protein FRC03_002364 [Tulasnella sp. 419]|nr:hypothetical protein FRC03_002364 [Tulasnella sp. 419]